MTDSFLIATIGWLITFVGGSFALWRWVLGQRIKRAEFLEKLIEKFKAINYDTYLQKIECPVDGDCDDSSELDAGIEAYDFLIFLSYVCYLRNAKIIDNAEFLSFRCYVERALRQDAVRSYLIDFHSKGKQPVSTSPYYALLEYGKNNHLSGMDKLYFEMNLDAKEEKQMDAEQNISPIKISVNDGKAYRTHLDVLNGIFNKGLLSHMRGASPLDEYNLVWFPRIDKVEDKVEEKSVETERNCRWRNTISSDGTEIREYWPDENGRDKVLKGVGKNRYVFAKCSSEQKDAFYRFKGVFKALQGDANSKCMVYKRIADSFAVDIKK